MSPDPTLAERPLGRVAVLGLGVMGGSLARGVSELGLAERVTGWSPDSPEHDAALTARAVTLAAAEWPEAVQDADLVILATPLNLTLQILGSISQEAPEATITDVASLKVPVATAASEAGLADRWVGSHPMVGSEGSGFWASRSDLFQGARIWTINGDVDQVRSQRVHSLWTALGADPAEIEAEEHDRLMEIASHLPRLVANVLADVIQQAGVGPEKLGPGGRDMTRLAASSPEMWTSLLQRASPGLIGDLRGFGHALEQIADELEAGDVTGVDALIRQTRRWSSGR